MAELQDVDKLSFWMPGNYVRTVRRTPDFYQVCEDVVACVRDRARVERQYAQQLQEWSSRWKNITETRPLYGSLMRAWQCFFSCAERLSVLHSSISHSLVSEDAESVRSWEKVTFQRKMFGGFRESHDFESGFARAQKPWVKKLKKLEKAQQNYYKSCEREQTALERERQAKSSSNLNPNKLNKIRQNCERATEERAKAREHYEKVLEELSTLAPRYMEEMELVFDQTQEQERKRMVFLKQVFLSIHRHLDITNNDSVKAVYSDLHHTLMSISEQDDLRWWRNHHGPGMPTDWPSLQEWVPPVRKMKRGRKPKPLTGDEKAVMIGGVRVRALYDYVGEESDELSFKAGEEFLKVEEEDEQGWCRGQKEGGAKGYYPANYVQVV